MVLALLILAVGLALFVAPELFATHSHGNLPSPDAIAAQPKFEKTELSEQPLAGYLKPLEAYMTAHKRYLDGERAGDRGCVRVLFRRRAGTAPYLRAGLYIAGYFVKRAAGAVPPKKAGRELLPGRPLAKR